MGEKNWTDKDWKWLVGILIGIIIVILSLWFAKTQGMETNFAIMSSAVSIALGSVAIFIALKQDSDSQRLNQQMQNTLKTMEYKIDNVNHNVKKLDVEKLESVIRESVGDFVKNIGTSTPEKQLDPTNEQLQQLLEEAVPYLTQDISSKINNESRIFLEDLPLQRGLSNKVTSELVYQLLTEEPKGMSFIEIHQKMRNTTRKIIHKVLLEQALRTLRDTGKIEIEKTDNETFYKVKNI
ncbi:hypothetical protein BHL07_14540 [Bacillus cereus]|uniref:hypothetical protein n=1 Tax=Bacillus cereus TaxID=1396 RepID=UPI000994EA57|nr:hypothetical protein [Bacillus cereus]OPA39692.1 hypothetical protein BHL07_14540 [Bacillus cereus]